MTWFNDWFNSPYYHILYANHDYEEAGQFVGNLAQKLAMVPGDTVLDLACGKGRHSIFLNKLGFNVHGIDLSENNIEKAKLSETENLHFAVHDMRQVYLPNTFNYVLNLFTSFGYFDNDSDNLLTIRAASANLKDNGLLVIDFMNSPRIVKNLVKQHLLQRGNIEFNITKTYNKGVILKQIAFSDAGQSFQFREEVRALLLADFVGYFKESGLELVEIFGNYNLQPYNENDSDRMILIAKKVVY
jgi:cyclopropane fatty-acyl-phospholipid synthase-like methyltransferase